MIVRVSIRSPILVRVPPIRVMPSIVVSIVSIVGILIRSNRAPVPVPIRLMFIATAAIGAATLLTVATFCRSLNLVPR